MGKIHQPISFGEETDGILDRIEETDASQAYGLTVFLRKNLRSNLKIITHLSLASAKWVDHSGPLIGHGILNADPILRAMELLPEEHRIIPPLQFAMYVLDLLRNPNHGPYSMQEIKPMKGQSEDETSREFSKAVRSGNMKHTAEKLLAGLHSFSPRHLAEYVLYEGLMQYGENEHRLLLPYHTLKLLERGSNRNYTVTLLRPSIQYLSTSPDISRGVKAEQVSKQVDFNAILGKGDAFNQENAYDITRMLLNSSLGNEMAVIADYSKASSLQDLYEAVALTSTLLLLNSDLEPHAVTGKHCILSILKDTNLSHRIRKVALLSSLEGPRARRLKSYILKSLDNYLGKTEIVEGAGEDELLVDLEMQIMESRTDQAFNSAGLYLRSGYDADKLTGILLSAAFQTEGPLESLHTSKMLVGMRDITLSSRSGMKWLHLAAGARFVAEMVKRERAESSGVHDQMRRLSEITGKPLA